MKKMFTLALVVAAMLSASVSASAQSRKGELMKSRKGEVRKEIRFRQGGCPKVLDKRFVRFDGRFDPRFDRGFEGRDFRFDQHGQFDKFAKHRKHHAPHRR